MNETEAPEHLSGYIPETVPEPEPMLNPWRVLKRDEKADSPFIGAVWIELATISSVYSYSYPGVDEVGALGGAGEYLLIGEHSTKTLVIEAVTKLPAGRER